ncbi:MAG: dihydropteroate synthase [Pedobacter sp.]|nr:MAG: dihydropteroate synthase [Pedobacter sp.]
MQATNANPIDFKQPAVMAILNLTPDSFYANSRVENVQFAIDKCGEFLDAGAQYIDLGAYSTRPGATPISESEELNRLLPILSELVKNFPTALFSIDTFRANVAEQSILTGAHIINDISAGELDAELPKIVAKYQVPYIFMHMRGNPQNMQDFCQYEDLIADIYRYFELKITYFKNLGISDLILDPGFGFAKNLDQNYQLLKNLEAYNSFELPILVGFSRKSMLTKYLEIASEKALNGTTILNTYALLKGASILRVHDPLEAKQCIQLIEKITAS